MITLAISGGVDSAVAGLLLQEAGWKVQGVHYLFSPTASSDDARRVADALGIPLRVIPVYEQFKQDVLIPSWMELVSGRTPNPCVFCNRCLKFPLLRDADSKLMATGHYVRIEDGFLCRGTDCTKDQSYFLWGVDKHWLSSMVFPLGTKTKAWVREFAQDRGLVTSRESQDSCIASASKNMAPALQTLVGSSGKVKSGNFVDEAGNVLGVHSGVHQFTVGQRRGLGLATLGKPVWVKSINSTTGDVVVTDTEESLLTSKVVATGARWLTRVPPHFQALVKIRYNMAPVGCSVTNPDDGRLIVDTHSPVRAVTPGQSLVLYDGDRVLGGGFIQ